MKGKYVYFKENIPINHVKRIDSLRNIYYQICNKKYINHHKEIATEEFMKNMNEDGYLVCGYENDYHFFIELSRIDNIFIQMDESITKVVKEKLKEFLRDKNISEILN